jgi:hypothetical protein
MGSPLLFGLNDGANCGITLPVGIEAVIGRREISVLPLSRLSNGSRWRRPKVSRGDQGGCWC